MPTKTGRPFPFGVRRVSAGVLALTVAACAGQADRGGQTEPTSPGNTSSGLIALVASGNDPTLLGWGASAVEGVPVDLPAGITTWIATGRANVLAATRADGTVATSDPVDLGEALDWRRVRAVGPDGGQPDGPQAFATWDPEGGRYAVLAGDLAGGDDVRIVLVDPTLKTAFEIDLDRSIVAAPPVWIGDDRLAVVSGDTAEPMTTLVDTTTGQLTDGPGGARLLAASGDAVRVATMAGRGSPIVVRETAAWLDGDDASLGVIDPPDDASTAIAFALDRDGARLAIAWAADDGSVSIGVYDAAADWQRVASPGIGAARGAVVAWRRGG